MNIIVAIHVLDQAGYQTYREKMTPILQRFGGFFAFDFAVDHTFKAPVEHAVNRLFSIQFPDRTTMDKFFSDSNYLDVRKAHFESSVGGVTILRTS